jgi:DNA polymerase III epsilon subunit-like protein
MLIPWLGKDGFDDLWQSTARDTMTLASSIDDLYACHGRKPPFGWVNLGTLCKKFDIELDNAHDALADCVATAKLYASIMRFLYG